MMWLTRSSAEKKQTKTPAAFGKTSVAGDTLAASANWSRRPRRVLGRGGTRPPSGLARFQQTARFSRLTPVHRIRQENDRKTPTWSVLFLFPNHHKLGEKKKKWSSGEQDLRGGRIKDLQGSIFLTDRAGGGPHEPTKATGSVAGSGGRA